MNNRAGKRGNCKGKYGVRMARKARESWMQFIRDLCIENAKLRSHSSLEKEAT